MNMPIVGCIGESIIGSDERGLWFLSHKDDPAQMNWVEGETCWGGGKGTTGTCRSANDSCLGKW